MQRSLGASQLMLGKEGLVQLQDCDVKLMQSDVTTMVGTCSAFNGDCAGDVLVVPLGWLSSWATSEVQAAEGVRVGFLPNTAASVDNLSSTRPHTDVQSFKPSVDLLRSQEVNRPNSAKPAASDWVS